VAASGQKLRRAFPRQNHRVDKLPTWRGFRRRAAIEPVISHLKHQYRLGCCFLKRFIGDTVNLMLAAAAWNLKKWMREGVLFWLQLIRLIARSPVLTALPACL
jgi:hypothetical protein